MLKFAKLYEDNLLAKLRETCTENKYRYCYYGYISIPKINNDDWNYIQRVSVCQDKLLGFISASVNRTNMYIDALLLVGFEKYSYVQNKIFIRDMVQFLYQLLSTFPYITWSVVAGNPVQKTYQRLVKFLNGNVIGLQHSCALIEGKRMDCELYEILSSEEILGKLQKLLVRLERSQNG